MGRIVSPSKSEIPNLRTPLQPGEQMVLDLFEATLSDDWEIYTQPHLNGCRPDFVLLNPNVGIAVFEVKDWKFDAMGYRAQTGVDGRSKLIASKDGKTFQVTNPLKQVQRYKREIYNLYCPRLAEKAGFATITAGVIFPYASADQLNELLPPLSESVNLFPQYDPISGAEAVQSGDIARIFPESNRLSSNYMSDDFADDMRSWLIEPDYSAEQRQPLELDSVQRDLVESRTESGYRRIRGPAGSGKSLILAARAASLAASGKDVLVVTFNITLIHYLRDLCARWPDGRPNQITWMNFHQWCKRIVEEIGLGTEYRDLWRHHYEDEGDDEYDTNSLLGTDIPQLIRNGLRSFNLDDIDRYDAVIVDEGQDFQPLWWETLREIHRPDGEMILAADMTQDVYGTGSKWTDDAMVGAGFRGPWSELRASYRLPQSILVLAAKFANAVLPEEYRSPPQPPPDQSELDLSPCDLKWVQTVRDNAAEACVNELFDLIRKDEHNNRAIPDLTLLTDNIDDGIKIAAFLGQRGVKTVHTFADVEAGAQNRPREDRRKKLGFWKGDARVKLTTLHSFKGWEGRLIVLNITHAKTPKDFALIYTGLTRLKKHPLGSCMTVVCSENRLKRFGDLW
jgi:hypothetical protein